MSVKRGPQATAGKEPGGKDQGVKADIRYFVNGDSSNNGLILPRGYPASQ